MASNTPQSEKLAAAKKKAQAQVNAQQRRALVVWIVVGVVVVGLFAALTAYIVRQGNVTQCRRSEPVDSFGRDCEWRIWRRRVGRR